MNDAMPEQHPTGEFFRGAQRMQLYRDGAGSEDSTVFQGPAPAGEEDLDLTTELFAVSEPVREDDPGAVDGPVPAPVPLPVAGTPAPGPGAVEGRVVGTELVRTDPAGEQESPRSVWQRVLARLGLGAKGPDPAAEDAKFAEEFERIIRQATWPRAVNVAVMQRSGGDGVTPVSLMLANTLAFVRGGGVAVVEATASDGGLGRVAEGQPRRGLEHLLASRDRIDSAGALAGYSAPQTSHARVFGSTGRRGLLSWEDVRTARGLLDRYYEMTVTDTDHTLEGAAASAVLELTDAVVIPCVRHPQSVQDAVLTFEHVAAQRPDLVEARRVVFVLGSDGPGEDPGWVAHGADRLREVLGERVPVSAVQAVPFEPVMKAGGEIVHARCSTESVNAWKRVAAGVVDGLLDVEEEPPAARHRARVERMEDSK